MSHQANSTHLVLGLGDGAVRHDLLDGDHAAVMTTDEVSLEKWTRVRGLTFRVGWGKHIFCFINEVLTGGS